jgi:hypothetical protein
MKRRKIVQECLAAGGALKLRDLEERHLGAEMLAAQDFFAISAEDDEDHAFYILRAIGPMQQAADDLEDLHGNVVHEGTFYVPCHYLEWRNKEQETYYVDAGKIVYIASHLVAIPRLEMERHGGRGEWKIAPEGEIRIDTLLL